MFYWALPVKWHFLIETRGLSFRQQEIRISSKWQVFHLLFHSSPCDNNSQNLVVIRDLLLWWSKFHSSTFSRLISLLWNQKKYLVLYILDDCRRHTYHLIFFDTTYINFISKLNFPINNEWKIEMDLDVDSRAGWPIEMVD